MPETITSNGALWTNTYNKRRLNESETLAYGGTTYRIGRSYDANGSLAQLTYPDNVTVAYNPNALGEPRQAGAYASAVAYHPSGAIKSFTYGNGIAHSISQNVRGLPEWSEDVGILSIGDWREGISNRGLTYDGLNRLMQVNAPSLWGDAFYTYDAQDNLTSARVTAGGTARTTTHKINPATNLLDSITNSAGSSYNFIYGYDSQGNIIKRGAQSYAFDLANRMTGSTGKATYAYDGLGHRISVVGTDGVNRVQVYSQGGQLLYVKATNTSTATMYVYLHNHVLAEVNGATVTYDHTDGLGSPVAQTNASGVLLNRTRYEPYGAVASGNAGTIGFSGHVNDNDTGLVYMQQRYYDPVAGRFLSIDPVPTDANTGSSFNRYAYANNSPYKYIDPDGRFPVGIFVGIGVEIGIQMGMEGKSFSELDVSNIIIAGAIGAFAPGVGSTMIRGYQAGTKVSTGLKAISKLKSKTANTANRAQKLVNKIDENAAKIAEELGEAGKAAAQAAAGVVAKKLRKMK